MNLLREIKNLIKISIREPSLLFWSLIFPLVLSSVMMLVLTGMVEKVEIPLGVSEDYPMKEIYEQIPALKVTTVNEEEAKKQLLEDDLNIGYIDSKGELHVSSSNSYTNYLYRIQREVLQAGMLYEMGYTPNFASQIKVEEESTNTVVIFISAILAMTSVYSYFFGTNFMILYQANLSTLGLRLTISPSKKSVQLLAALLTGIAINLSLNYITILYLKLVFNLDFLQDFWGSFAILLAANIFGMGLGIFIGAANKLNENTKIMIGTGIGMFFGFTSGMMNDSAKADFLEKFPVLMRFNPGNIVSSTLYRTNFLGSRAGLMEGILILLGFALIFYLLSYASIRRRKYDYL